MDRPYNEIATFLAARLRSANPRPDSRTRMRWVADALWEALHTTGVSWLGFYLPEGDLLVLGPMRNKPACSPIGLHGVCGRAFQTGTPQVVADVRTLGADYIPCDPRDLSEVVVPLLGDDGRATAVLDLDSHAVGSFDNRDVEGLVRVLRAVELTAQTPPSASPE